MPSILFIVNRKVVKFIVMTAQAFNCPIPKYTKFGRKNHFYSDVMQGYRITRCDIPMALDRALIEETRVKLSELPDACRDRFVTQCSLSLYDDNLLTNCRNHGRLLFKNYAKIKDNDKTTTVRNCLSRDSSRFLNAIITEIENAKISP